MSKNKDLLIELEELEKELDYQVSHKRISEIQKRIDEIEEILKHTSE